MRFRIQSLSRVILFTISMLFVREIGAQKQTAEDYRQRFVALAAAPGLTDSARLHRLFDLDWEYSNVVHPEFATYTGYPGQNDRWTDLSISAINARAETGRSELSVLGAIDRARLNAADQLSYDIFKRGANEFVEGLRFPSNLLQITQRDGPQY